MKRFTMIMICLLAMMTASQGIKAQEVTIYLYPGYTWISYPRTDTLDFTTALNSFTPMAGDIIKSQWGNASYINGQWRGSISKFYPGYGYMYKSTRMVPVPLTFTIAHKPKVSTLEAINITATTATVGGNILDDGSATITQCGVCWSTEPNPTISDSVIIAEGVTIGEFSMELTGLTTYAIYYVRAFATNSIGTTYGDEVSFEAFPEGAIKGLFSVSETRQVWFSQGNLQYQAETNTFRFAPHQYNYVGEENSNINDINYLGWIDLFGWGTSGWDNGNVYYHPNDYLSTGIESNGFGYGPIMNDLTDEFSEADWGVYNAITNGGNQTNQWRTLTFDEWVYLSSGRQNAEQKKGMATIVNVKGIILLPDTWVAPEGITFVNATNYSYYENVYSLSEWRLMEEAGAVFLPCAGIREGTNVNNCGIHGHYWSSTALIGMYQSFTMYIAPSGSGFVNNLVGNYVRRDDGCSVRLVKDY